MTVRRTQQLWILMTCLVLSAFVPVLAQVDGVTREQMWPAPTDEDWKKPCLIHWQRTWEDAQVVSKETGKPILVCVSMDGEIASEHYAGIRYRQPEICKLYEPYVTVIASVYRHTERDYDENGNRIPCPRFGTVTCGEHIRIEPILYEKFMDGQRIAPRHIMVELDGSESYDVFYAFDTDSVFGAIREGIAKRPPELLKEVRGDRTIVERVASRNSADREAVEKAYAEGDENLRRALLEAASQNPDAAPIDLLRKAVFGLDPDLSKLARQALANATDERGVDLIAETLRIPLDSKEREQLVGALARLGATSDRARALAQVHRGLAENSASLDLDNWSKAMTAGATYLPASDPGALATEMARAMEVSKSDRPEDHLNLARAYIARAVERGDGDEFEQALLMDAMAEIKRGEELGAIGWLPQSLACVGNYYLGKGEEATRRAVKAMEFIPEDATEWNTMIVVGLFADQRRQAILKALKKKEKWPGKWMTDVHSAYSILGVHPHGDDMQIEAHVNFLNALGGYGKANETLDAGLRRFPDSWRLHKLYRDRIIRERGIRGLERAYAAMAEGQSDLPEESRTKNLSWFSGYASMMVAEYQRRGRRSHRAIDTYQRAIDHFDRSLEEHDETRESALYFKAMSYGGRGRVALEQGELESAVTEIIKSFETKPDSANALDGLNISSVDTAKMLRARLRETQQTELLEELQAALDKLDPKMLELPAYEGAGPRGGAREGSGRRGGRRGGRNNGG